MEEESNVYVTIQDASEYLLRKAKIFTFLGNLEVFVFFLAKHHTQYITNKTKYEAVWLL